MNAENRTVCPICGLPRDPSEMVSGRAIRPAIAVLIAADHPGWSPEGLVCRADLNIYRARHVQALLKADKGELSLIEDEVIKSLREGELIARNVDSDYEERRTVGDRVADRLAAFGGSWRFIIIFGCIILAWIALNAVVLLVRPFDPFPFILLNLVLSCLAALQAPVIMMSQNRQEAKDRLRARHDYQVNLKAEIEIRSLHEKIDHLIFKQWQRLLEIQEVQTDLMEELVERLPEREEDLPDR